MLRLCSSDAEGVLDRTEYTQPALLSVSVGIYRALVARFGIDAQWVAGHSLGEYSALVAVGALDFADALRLVRHRGQAMSRAVPDGEGGMLAYLGVRVDAVRELCGRLSREGGVVEVANYNTPRQIVLSGHRRALAAIDKMIAAHGLGSTCQLNVATAFHSSLMRPASLELAALLEATTFHDFSGCIVANVDAELHSADTYGPELLVEQAFRPVLWSQTLSKLDARIDDPLYVEVGPGVVLKKLAQRTLLGCRALSAQDSKELHLLEDALQPRSAA